MTAIMGVIVILVASFGIGLMAQDSYAQGPKYYRVKVTFDTITVHNDHDGFGKGAGEWHNFAFVQGKDLSLNNVTPESSCTRLVPGPVNSRGVPTYTRQLYPCPYAEEGRTFKFNPGTEITVDLRDTVPLSIFSFGLEQDFSLGFCHGLFGRGDALPIFDHPVSVWSSEIDNFVSEMFKQTVSCNNEILGNIKEFYDPPGYGAGPHEVKSYSGDYTIKYTISASPTRGIPIPGDITKFPIVSICNNNLQVSSASSSGFLTTFDPGKAIDNNPNTYWWSTPIANTFITLDLGASKSLCGVEIAYQDGALYHYEISLSTDGTTFTKVLSGTRTDTTSPEKYDFPPAQAKYVKLTITGSVAGTRISELDVFG